MKYRKKPIIIEAMQWDGTIESFEDIIEEFKPAPMFLDLTLNKLAIEPIGLASRFDWIIKGIEGEFYACPDSVFKKSYEKVEAV